MEKKTFLWKAIAILIIFVMAFHMSSNLVFGVQITIEKETGTEVTNVTGGEEVEQTNVSEQIATTTNLNKQEEQGNIVGEAVSKRTLNTKTYNLDNGTSMVAVYPTNVHYEENGKLQDIDNSIKQEKNTDKKLGSDTAEDVLGNTKNKLKVKFTKNIKAKKSTLADKKGKIKSAQDINPLMNIAKGQYNLSFGLLNANDTKAITNISNSLNITDKKMNIKVDLKNKNAEKMELKSIESKITYENILKSIDLNYTLIGDEVKENIILKEKLAINSNLEFILNTGTLLAEKTKEGIIIYDKTKDNIVFVIDPFLMWDGKLEYSDQIETTLEKIEGGYKLTITPDKNWLQASERVFPITIDPSVSTSLDNSAIKDAYIYEGDQNNWTRGVAHILRAGNSKYLGPNGGNPVRTLLKFELPPLDAGDQVIDARLTLYNYPDTSEWTPPANAIQLDVCKMTTNWESNKDDPAYAFWNNLYNSYDSKIVDYNIYQFDYANPNTCYPYNFSVTSIVKDWYTTGNNYGLMIKDHYETTGYTTQSDAYFISSDTTSTYYNVRPQITIQYRNQTGLEEYLSYHEKNVGRAGTLYTNDYNGNLVLIHDDLSTPGQRMPVSINHVWNSNDKDIDIGYGLGYRLNFSQTVLIEDIQTESGTKEYAKYIDEDGTAHYFLNQPGTGTYLDEDGLGLKLTQDGTGGVLFYLEDKEGNKSTFRKHADGINLWHLTKIEDTEGNSINITIDYNNLREFIITAISDGAGDTIQLTYENNRLYRITDPSGKILTYSYDQTGRVTQIMYPDGDLVQYDFNVNNLLITANNCGKGAVCIEYYNENTSRVKTIAEYSKTWEIGNALYITYGNNATIFTDNNGYKQNMTFNNWGQSISIIDLGKGNEDINQAYGKSYNYGTSGAEKNKLLLEGSLKKLTSNLLYNGEAEKNEENWEKWQWGVNAGTQSITTEEKCTGNKSFKFVGGAGNTYPIYNQSKNVTKGKTYTLSAKVKTKNLPNSEYGAVLMMAYVTTNGQWVTQMSPFIKNASDWEKCTLTFTYGIDANSPLYTTIGLLNATTGCAYFDDVQLEEGTVANPYNYIENGGFDDGLNKWQLVDSTTDDRIINSNGNNILQLTGDRTRRKYACENIYTSGKQGDTFEASSLVKNNGVPIYGNRAATLCILVVGENGEEQWSSTGFNVDSSGWQYVSHKFITNFNYKQITIFVTFYNNGNTLLADNISLFKDETGNSYTYDSNGNLISTQDLAKQNSTFQYDGNNNLTKMINPRGGNFTYEYDSVKTHRLTSAKNIIGQKYSFNYDNYGNIITSKTEESKKSDLPQNGQIYKIRVASSDKCFDIDGGVNATGNGPNLQQWEYGGNLNQKFKLEEIGNGYYRITPMHATEKAIDMNYNNNNIYQSAWHGGDNQLWKFIENADGTYKVISKYRGENYCVALENDSKNNGGNIYLEKWEGKTSQRIILENINTTSNQALSYIQTNAEYTPNGKYMTKQIDEEGNETQYTTNDLTGTISKVTDAKNTETNYTYDTLDRLTAVSKTAEGLNYNNEYTYLNDKLNSITSNGTIYSFVYDTFGNTKQVKVGDQVLITNNYAANNGNLSNYVYGNNQTVSYTYDRFNRVTQKTGTNGAYNYIYNAKSNLASVSDGVNNTTENYTYDLAERLVKAENTNGLKTEYGYDANSNVNSAKYSFGTTVNTTSYNYDRDNRINSIRLNTDKTILTNYDRLSRMVSKQIQAGSATYNTVYTYKNTATTNKTTTKVASIKNGSETEIKYTYDVLGNIETISKGTDQRQKFYYDELSQLIREDNKDLNKTITYSYDAGGNITTKTEYAYTTETVGTPTKTTNYQYANTNWKDQLTNYDGNAITYDEIGNPTSYNGYTYTWGNGRQLLSMSNGTNTYSYKYNDSGIRTEKTINGVTTKYYLEGTKVIYEQTGANANYNTFKYNFSQNLPWTYHGFGIPVNTTKNYTYSLDVYITADANIPTTGTTLVVGAENGYNYYFYYDNSKKGTWQHFECTQIPTTNKVDLFLYPTTGQTPATTGYIMYKNVQFKEVGTSNNLFPQPLDNSGFSIKGNGIFECTNGSSTDNIYYTYDEMGEVIGINYNNTQYYYQKNAQGDIIGILDSNLNKVVNYTYDTWGKVVSITDGSGTAITDQNNIGYKNPYLYRGYRYDRETGMYYLQSRYYNPEWGRFINADSELNGNEDILGYNLYTYVSNNPINFSDLTGHWKLPNWAKIITGVVAIAVGVIATVATGGAAGPAIIAGVKGAAIAGAIGAAISTITSVVKSVFSGNNVNTVVKNAEKEAVEGFSNGFMMGGITAGASQVVSAGFKTATNIGLAGGSKSGIQLSSNLKILSPNAAWHKKDIGGTLLKTGKNFRIDVGSSTLLHMHISIFPNAHIPMGTLGAGIYGGTR